VTIRWREDIHDDWSGAPLLYLDATIVPEVARYWLPRLEIKANVEAAETHVTRIGLTDRAMGKTSLSPDAHQPADEQARRENNRRRTCQLAELVAASSRGSNGATGQSVAVVANRDVEHELRKILPAGVATGHFNNLRGFDGWRGVRGLIVVGRPMPDPISVERMASIASGSLIGAIGGWYPKRLAAHLMRDGTGRVTPTCHHPDHRVEPFRRQVLTELVQVGGRGRGVRRTAANPLVEIWVTDEPTGSPMDIVLPEAELMSEITCIRLLAARGIVPDNYADAAAILSDEFRSSSAPAAALRKKMEREGSTGALAEIVTPAAGAVGAPGVVTFPYK
jgi:putative DNA primase/helicase